DVDRRGAGQYGAGMTFLPQHADQRHRCQDLIQGTVAAEGMDFLGWRDVPVNPDAIGVLAAKVRPVIRQFFVGRPKDIGDDDHYEAKLYVVRKRIEKVIDASDIEDRDAFYICSLSSRTIVYKGLLI